VVVGVVLMHSGTAAAVGADTTLTRKPAAKSGAR